MNPVHRLVSEVRIRLAVHAWCLYTIRGLVVGSTIGCLWIVLTRLYPQLGDAAPGSVALLVIGAVVMSIWAGIRYPSRVHATLELDKRLDLNERVTSSLEMEGASGPMVDALHRDVAAKVESLSYTRAFPWVSSGGLKWLSPVLVAAGLLYMFMPEFDLTRHNERIAEAKANEAVTAVAVERIDAIKKSLSDIERADSDALTDFDMALDKLKNDLERGKISEKQMIARVSNLSDDLRVQRNAFQKNSPTPKVAGDLRQFSVAKELASAMQQGKMGEAAEIAKALQEKMKRGDMSAQEKKALQKDLKALSEMLGGQNTELGAALAKASAGMESGDMEGALAAMKGADMSLADLESIMQQLKQMDQTMFKLAQWKQGSLGSSEYCRECGAKLTECDGKGGQCDADGHTHSGVCGSCSGSGLGLRGAGRGQGNRLGELPDVNFGTTATKATGPMTKGRMLADIMQKASPELGQDATVEMISGAFVQLQQETEQALTQEKIPDASKELVRQYFGALEPENGAQ